MTKNSDIDMRTPGIDKTGPVPVKPPAESMPVELLIQQRKEGQAASAGHDAALPACTWYPQRLRP